MIQELKNQKFNQTYRPKRPLKQIMCSIFKEMEDGVTASFWRNRIIKLQFLPLGR